MRNERMPGRSFELQKFGKHVIPTFLVVRLEAANVRLASRETGDFGLFSYLIRRGRPT